MNARFAIVPRSMEVSSGLEIRVNLPNKGRGLFATKDFQEGDVLFEESPLVCAQFSWNALYKYAACDHCMASLETAEESVRRLTNNATIELPHPECCETRKDEIVTCKQCNVRYCSVSCRDVAESSYHRVLCLGPSQDDPNHPYNRLTEAWRQIHYPPETASIILPLRMVACVKQASDKQKVIQQFSQFCKVSVNEEKDLTHKLLGDKFQDQIELFRSIFAEHFYEDSVQQWFSPEGFRSLFALIGTNGQGIGSSSISRWVQNCEQLSMSESEREAFDLFVDDMYEELDRVSGSFLNAEGSGLYSLQSTCNHSCEPNAEVTFPFNNSTVAVKAVTDISAGEEILICYLDECERSRSRHSRQKQLRENYLFTCECTRCESQAEEPDVTSDEEEEMEDEEEGEGEETS